MVGAIPLEELPIMNQKEALLTPSLGESNLYRPIWHLSPSKGWMNDPNGFHYANGEFVLYYQHHDALEGDTLIDWARTTSKDLITFHDEGASLLPSTREEGVGISPLWGGCWSGSSFYEKGEEVLCYTATSKEGEVLAFARRKDGHFFLERNIPFVYPPVHIPKEYFRDPEHAQGKKTVMVVTVAATMDFHTSSVPCTQASSSDLS